MSADGGRDIQQGFVDYVANFSTVAAGKKFNPHVTIGVAPDYLKEMLAEPFKAFVFSSVGASVYQLRSFGAGGAWPTNVNLAEGPLGSAGTLR